LILDSLTRDMYHDPSGFMKQVEKLYLSYLNDPTSLDLTGIDMFFLIKYPSVLKPINEFVKASSQSDDAPSIDVALERIKQGISAEATSFEEDDEGVKEQIVLRAMNYIVEADPTQALRINIFEAALAGIVLFAKRTDLVSTGQYPPSTIGGFVLASDEMIDTMPGTSCNAACLRIFGTGKFTFTDSFMWMNLYNGWNLSLMFSATCVGDWMAKLITPAVLEDQTGESYIIRRTIALWLTLFRKAFVHHNFLKEQRCRWSYAFGDTLDIVHLMGLQVKRYGDEYEKLWHVPVPVDKDGRVVEVPKCPACITDFRNQLTKHVWKRQLVHTVTKISTVVSGISDRIGGLIRDVGTVASSVAGVLRYADVEGGDVELV